MVQALTAQEFFQMMPNSVLLDLRAAADFAANAFTGAQHLPARGATTDGLAATLATNWPGQRWLAYDHTGEFAPLCEGIVDLHYLQGGLLAWQHWLDACLAEGPAIMILGGKTGAGKTEWLYRLRAAGAQMLDLEGLAQHKGSAFGNLEGRPQLGNLAFQAELLGAWLQFEQKHIVWIEEEGPFLGQVAVPKVLYARMLAAPMIELDVPFPQRLAHIIAEYGDAPAPAFEAAIQKLVSRMGLPENQRILHKYRDGKKREAFQRLLAYYDNAYEHRRTQFRTGESNSIVISEEQFEQQVRSLIDLANSFS
jgi:tRNA 2-selenouridine synthase